MDLSECAIDGIMVSDQFTELSGVKVSLLQAAELARLMGVKIDVRRLYNINYI